MKTFPIIKKGEFKQTVAVLDSSELKRLIAEAIAEKLGIDLNNKMTSFYYTNLEVLKNITSVEFEANAIAIHFIERTNDHV